MAADITALMDASDSLCAQLDEIDALRASVDDPAERRALNEQRQMISDALESIHARLQEV